MPPFACKHIIRIDMDRKLRNLWCLGFQVPSSCLWTIDIKWLWFIFQKKMLLLMKTQAYFRTVTPLMLILFICSFERQGYRSGNLRTRNSYSKYNDLIERFRVTLTANGKREFVPRDKVIPLHV